MDSLISSILKTLHREAWDVIGLGSTDSYNDIVIADGKESVLTLLPPNHLVMSVGHSRKKWIDAKKLLAENNENPFDYMSEQAGAAIQEMCIQHRGAGTEGEGTACLVFHSHSSDPFLVSFQRLAVATGIGVLHKETHLVLHRQFGSWIALRFALVLPLPAGTEEHTHICLHDRLKEYIRVAKVDHNELLSDASGITVSEDEHHRVAEVLQKMKQQTGATYDPSIFLEARKSFSLGKSFMYEEDQMAYHYHL